MVKTLLCAAKVNLVLSIPKRYVDGYHEVCSVMQTVGLYDRITVEKADKITVLSENSPCGEDNICYKAAELFKDFGGARIEINKGIPLLSGLGGGSSDAAGTLLALNSLYGQPYSVEELEKMSLTLGSDVPFFIRGGTQLVSGKGDGLIKLPDYNGFFVLIKHGKKKSTGQMYGELDKIGLIDRTQEVKDFCANMENGKPFNDFSRVFDCEDVLADLLSCGAIDACLSGSGPTVFGIFGTKAAAEDCKKRLKDKYTEIYVCPSVDRGIIFE